MKLAQSAACSVLLALALSGCQTNRDVSTGYGGAEAGRASPASATSAYSRAMERLQQAAQNLREATQAMAQQPAGQRRNAAIRQAHAAILEANGAMGQLYQPRAASGAVGTTSGIGQGGTVGGTVYPKSDADYTRAMEKLLAAAQKFRESIQAMAQMPAGPQRDQAIQQAHQALFDTNQAMIQLPPELRSENPQKR